MLDCQNNLILEQLSKQEQLSTSLQEVRSELRETKETVGKVVQENKATSSKDDAREKMKRKYPSSLTVSIQCLFQDFTLERVNTSIVPSLTDLFQCAFKKFGEAGDEARQSRNFMGGGGEGSLYGP